MTRNLKISLALVVACLAAATVAVMAGGDDPATAPDLARDDQLVRPDSQRLSNGSSDVTFVEFLDFECEACRAAHPAIEELRGIYDEEVTFVVRNFPLHRNSENAARAAEAAAAQGEFEAMVELLFETQPEWGEQQTPQREVFFDLAERLELDMAEFARVFDDEATGALIDRDEADGRALGVNATPTFFLDGEMIRPTSFEDLTDAFDAALAQ